jgi:UDP-N-acetylmuramoylalanine--D-glutamate ligase
MRARPPLPQGPYLVVGLARSGITAALALRERGEQVLGVDTGAPAGAQALAGAGVELHLREDGTSLLGRVGSLVKSPGVPSDVAVVLAARALGLPVVGELELAWRLLPSEFIAVTGTNGKTTTVELIGHIYREAGRQVALAGNVGIAASGLVPRAAPDLTIVCEASSFQLEDTIAFAPEAAVLLNLTPDHLDRHHNFESYVAAKLQAFARQEPDDVAVLPLELELAPSAAGPRTFGEIEVGGRARRVRFARERQPKATIFTDEGSLWWRAQRLMDLDGLALRGEHNAQNAMAAALVCLERGLAIEAVTAGLATFPGVRHRLEELARIAGVLYVNDSKATNLASTLAALQALAAEGSIHLILGGQAKGQRLEGLREPVARHCSATYLIGEDASQIERAIEGIGVAIHRCGDLERALELARSNAHPGEVVLLSPGCASFDQFTDYEERGERFRELVGRLQEAGSAPRSGS